LLEKLQIPLLKVAVTVTTTFKSGGDKSPSSHTKVRLAGLPDSFFFFFLRGRQLAVVK